MEDSYFFGQLGTQSVVTGPLRYRPEAVQRDIANLTAALAEVRQAGRTGRRSCRWWRPPACEVGLADEHYGNPTT